MLAQLRGVSTCEIREQMIVLSTDEPNSNFVLAALLQQDIRVLQFAENEVNLEEIFMRSTAGKVT
jgi:hypothetical protein